MAGWLNTDPDGLVLVQNATEAVQVSLASLRLESRAEVVYTDHTYAWVKAAIARECAETLAIMKETLHRHHPGLPGNAHGFWQSDRHGQNILIHQGDTSSSHSLLALLPEERLGVYSLPVPPVEPRCVRSCGEPS